MLKQVN